jgi:hypothetical protein
MRIIPVYKTEMQLGVADQVRANARIVYATQVELAQDTPEIRNRIQEMAKGMEYIRTHATNEGQIDLHYIKSLLVTVGWNKNDDVFDKLEVWMARATPEDKPFKYEHDARDIIGHVTGNYVIDFDGKTIADDLPIDEVPNAFHVATSGVLYKYWPEKDLMERMKNIIAEIPQGKWFVSMEALFDNFDYAVVAKDGTNRVIIRNEESAFLTKHLRAYGGSGVYEGSKVGRVLRNIIFSGKGLVRRPANPYSEIFDAVATFNKAVPSSVKEITKVTATSGYSLDERKSSNAKESKIMAAEVTQVELLQGENKRLEQTLSAAVAAQKDAEKRLTEMNEQAVKAKIDGLAQDVKARDEKISSLTTQVQTEQKARTEAEAKVADLEKKNTELQGQINKAIADSKKVARIATITTELALNTADAQKFYDDEVADLNLSDERFTKLVATFKKNKGAATPPPPPTNKTDAGDKTADTKVLDNAEPTTNKTPPTGGEGVTNNIEQTRAGLGNFLAKNWLGGRRKATASKNE